MKKFWIGPCLFLLLLASSVFAYTEVSGLDPAGQRDSYLITVLAFTEKDYNHYTDYQVKVIGPVPELNLRISHYTPTKLTVGKSYLVQRADKHWLIVKEVQ